MQAIEKSQFDQPVLNLGWSPRTAGSGADHPHADEIRPAVIAEVEGKPATKGQRAKLNLYLRGTSVAPLHEATQRANELAKTGDHEKAAAAAAEAAELLTDPYGGLVSVVKRRLAAHNQWAKSDHCKQLQAATAARDAAVKAWLKVEHDEEITTDKKRRLRRESEESGCALDSLLNCQDQDYTALRLALRPTGDRRMPACDWKSFKI